MTIHLRFNMMIRGVGKDDSPTEELRKMHNQLPKQEQGRGRKGLC